MEKAELGVIGIGVMGSNLALNIAGNGYRTVIYDHDGGVVRNFMESRAKENILPAYSPEEILEKLSRPAKILLMVGASHVDSVLEELLPLLESGDIVLDGGNSHFRDSERRFNRLKEKGVHFLGSGVSGGEYGALHGPSIMPGGSSEAYERVEDILADAAAETEEGNCVTYLGRGGSGHFVKMVHNGIEYGIMAIIAECYDIMRKFLQLEPGEMSGIFKEWKESNDSYLLDITWQILQKKDPETGGYLIDVIKDTARQKGTGRWSVQEALELGVSVPLMSAAVNARLISAGEEARNATPEAEAGPGSRTGKDEKVEILTQLEQAFNFAVLYAYVEGFKLLQKGAEEYSYQYSPAEIARIWGGGCIIRADLLREIGAIFRRENGFVDILFSSEFEAVVKEGSSALRKILALAAGQTSLPLPALSAVLNYYDCMRAEKLPANLIQAQRDYFGAHTYQRVDKEGSFHTVWYELNE